LTTTCSLRVRCKGNIAQHSKKGAYGTWSSTSAITSYSSISSENQLHDLVVEESLLISLDCLYYLVGANNKYKLIKNRKAFTKYFPGLKVQIEAFVKEHHTQFRNIEDLKTLLEYCNKLING